MMQDVDLTIKEINKEDRVCDMGHIAPETFKHPDFGEPIPMKFYMVSKSGDKGKVYCDGCLRISNFIKANPDCKLIYTDKGLRIGRKVKTLLDIANEP